MDYSNIIRSREMSVPDRWYETVEKSKDKARKLIQQIVAVDQVTSVVVGKLESVEIDKLWHLKYPYCRLTMAKPFRFRMSGRLEFKMGDQELFFVNKPEMIMTMDELSKKFPKIYEEIHIKLRKGAW